MSSSSLNHYKEVEKAWRKSYRGMWDMPALRLAFEPLNQQGNWAIYTNHEHRSVSDADANMLVHLPCNRHYPNWWLAPEIMGGAAQDPEIHCSGCDEKLPLETYYIFWGAYRLLNMTKQNDRNNNS